MTNCCLPLFKDTLINLFYYMTYLLFILKHLIVIIILYYCASLLHIEHNISYCTSVAPYCKSAAFTRFYNFSNDHFKKVPQQHIMARVLLRQVGQQLMPVVETGDVESLSLWLDWGLDVNTCGSLGWSLLHHSSARGQIEIVALLLTRCRIILDSIIY